jgi:hypothetical protein
MRLFNLRNALTVFLFAVILVFVITAAGYPFKAGIGGLAAGIPALILLVIVFIRDNIKGKTEKTKSKEDIKSEEDIESKEQKERVALTFHDYREIILWIVGLLILSFLFGMTIIFPLFTLAYIKVKGFSWRLSIIIAACVFVLIYVVYGILLKAPLYQGFIFEQLF